MAALFDPASVLSAPTNWRDAVAALVDHFIENGKPFSSGEIAREIRLARTDLAFSVPNLGEHVRDLFYAGGMRSYDDGNGGVVYPSQMPMTTTGKFRTPAGMQVFVYCIDGVQGQAHDFEVDIPLPPGVSTPAVLPVSTMPASTSTTAGSSTPKTPPTPVTLRGVVTANASLRAAVHADRRICVPRGALEAFVHATGLPMRGGQPVHVLIEAGVKATITLEPQMDSSGQLVSETYDIAITRGRVLFPAPAGSTPFVPNTAYAVKVSPQALTVDLTTTI